MKVCLPYLNWRFFYVTDTNILVDILGTHCLAVCNMSIGPLSSLVPVFNEKRIIFVSLSCNF